MDIGNFPKRVLLTGAGWSHNWGGRLAGEVWELLMDYPAVRANERLRNLLLEEPSFEAALARTHEQPFAVSDYAQLEQALAAAFLSMDWAMRQPPAPPNIYKVQEMLFRFFGQRTDGVDTGYIFTLNQDLFFERYLYNAHVGSVLYPALPGIQGKHGLSLFPLQSGPYGDDITLHPSDEKDWLFKRPEGALNIVKLHGSFNWRMPDMQNFMIIGTKKAEKIARFPLLAWYAKIFQRVLAAGGVRLMIVGYGFGYEHINDAIADAVEDHGLKVFIWNVDANLRDRVLNAHRGDAIWKGLLGKATQRMFDVFPANQAETEEYLRLQNAFVRQ